MTLDARQRQFQSFLVRRLLLALRADVDAQLAALDEGLIVPDEIRELPEAAAQVVVAAEPLWAGVDLAEPVTYEIDPEPTKEH